MSQVETSDQLSVYQELLDQSQHYKPKPMEQTFFDVGTRGHYENPTTELLKFFLDPQEAHGLGDAFFNGLIATVSLNNVNAGYFESIETEVTTNERNRIDLLVTTDNAVIAIECKINASQNNPFKDYESYIKNTYEKEYFLVILCVDGVSEHDGWQGIKYSKLTNSIKPFLDDALLANPLNKWAVLAKEFLLHLKNLEGKRMNDNHFNFINENLSKIDDLKKSEIHFFDEIRQRIIEAYKKETLTLKVRGPQYWPSIGPALWFSYPEWNDQSELALFKNLTKDSPNWFIQCCIKNSDATLKKEFLEGLGSKHKLQDLGVESKIWHCYRFNTPQYLDNIIRLVPEFLQALDAVEKTRN